MSSKSILIFCPYPLDTVPGQRLKYEQYLNFLRDNGYRIKVLPFFDKSTFSVLYKKNYLFRKSIGVIFSILRRIFQAFLIPFYDGVYIFLHVSPVGPPLLERLYLSLAKSSIYDIDDMVHHLRTAPANKYFSWIKSSTRYFYLLRRSSHVITCTPELTSIANSFNSCVTDISSTINTDTYLPVNTYSNEHPLTIGWTGSHSTVPYLHLLDDVFRRLSLDHDFTLLVMGTDSFSIPGVSVKCVPWSVSNEVPTLQLMDIGVYPLPDDEWVKGKSGLKALQYMALGLPVVASNVGCNDRVVLDGETGFLVSSEEEWFNSLSQLLRSASLRQSLGLSARQHVINSFSVSSTCHTYLDIFRSTF